MILAGDIGGTKTILALYKQQKGNWICHKKKIFVSASFDSFEKLIDTFLSKQERLLIHNVCIGVAGPVENGDCIATNLPWVIKRKDIYSLISAKHICLLNDFEATAWGVLALPEQDFVELNPDAKKNIGNIAILGAGTGLGEAMIIWNKDDYHVVATEGGHTDFAPKNELEIGLLRYLMGLHPDHVSYERVVSGQGLVNIYHYLKSIEYAQTDSETEFRMSKEDAAAVISEKAVASENELCVKALEMFCEIYGAEAGNLALKCLPKAGVVLAGGIAAKILPAMQQGKFMQGYLAKGRYKALLKNISVKICLNPEVALVGAASLAKNTRLIEMLGITNT
jgi:glucokinase